MGMEHLVVHSHKDLPEPAKDLGGGEFRSHSSGSCAAAIHTGSAGRSKRDATTDLEDVPCSKT